MAPADPGPAWIVLDTGPAVALDHLGYVDGLLNQRDLRLVLPRPVADELEGKPEAPGAGLARRISISEIASADLEKVWGRRGPGPALGAGELAVILLAERLRIYRPQSAIAIIDDRDAWRFAARRWGGSEELTGTLGLLYFIHERGLQRGTLQADVAALRANGYRFSEAEVEHFLASAGRALRVARETPPPAGELWLKRMRTAGIQRLASRRERSHPSERSIGEDSRGTPPGP